MTDGDGTLTTRFQKPTQDENNQKQGAQSDKYCLGTISNREPVYRIEDSRREHLRHCMQQAQRSQDLTRAVRRHMSSDGGRQRGGADAGKRGNHGGCDHHTTRYCCRVADIADKIEKDSGTDDADIEHVGAAVAGLLARAHGAAENPGDQGEDDDKPGDAADVGDGEELAGLDGVPAEDVLRVDEEDAHGAHGDAEHDGVDGG